MYFCSSHKSVIHSQVMPFALSPSERAGMFLLNTFDYLKILKSDTLP